MTTRSQDDESARLSAVAVMRLGLGARTGELDAVAGDPHAWLHDQVRPAGAPSPADTLPSSSEALDQVYARVAQGDDGAVADRLARAEISARFELGATTPAGFLERWALFWANHFSVTATSSAILGGAGAFEREAIRPNVFGRFEDLALAALRHPVMLLYYEQGDSAGPNSPQVLSQGGGMSENLGRESLELHILGRESGYTQADVREMSLALTGWSTTAEPQPVVFYFRDEAHEPGSRTMLGGSFASSGERQADSIVRSLSRRPETARHLARKLARHFVQDDPPASLVAQLRAAYLASGGSLSAVAHALIDAPETWAPGATKFKSPHELFISVGRALGRTPPDPAGSCAFMEQPVFAAPSPAGWPDRATAWLSPSALAKRAAWLQTLEAGELEQARLTSLAANALGSRLRPSTLSAISQSQAGTPQSLLFLSPEFQRR